MYEAENPYRSWGLAAADAEVSERASFIRQTYLHLLAAVVGFAALEAVLLNLPGIESFVGLAMQAWWLVILGFVGVSWIADSWARSTTSLSTQYLGLGLYVVAEAVIFLPMLYVAQNFAGPDVIPTAGLLTVLIFGGLTMIVFFTAADFSFLRTGLAVAGLAAVGIVLCGAIFGFTLGLGFSVAMLVLASGYILYETSAVLHHYRIGQHVAAALALFASVALLFWYVLRIVMSLSSRD